MTERLQGWGNFFSLWLVTSLVESGCSKLNGSPAGVDKSNDS